MSQRSQFNYEPIRADSPDAIDQVRFIRWLNLRFQKLASVLPGPATHDWGVSGTARTIKPYLTDVNTLALTANTTITLDTETRAGAEGDVELTQDATGGRTVSWVNCLNSTAIVIAAGANKRTLIRFRYVGGGWVGFIFASNY